MKQIFDCADRFVQSRDWKMVAMLKFCLCAAGALLGLSVPEKHKKTAGGFALGVFLATAIPLMADFFTFAADFFRPGNKEKVDG